MMEKETRDVVIVYLVLAFGALCITKGLCCVWDVEVVASRTRVSAWILLGVCYGVVSGWVFFLFVEAMGYYWYFRGKPAKGSAMMVYGVKIFGTLSVVTVLLVWWFF